MKEYTTEEQVNDYIENRLKKLYKIELNIMGIITTEEDKYDDKNYFHKYFKEKSEKIFHFIFINEFPKEKPEK